MCSHLVRVAIFPEDDLAIRVEFKVPFSPFKILRVMIVKLVSIVP